ncbi:MAG: GntP family permease [Planctomycetia bacterium]|nr:GntP family permease [Planctomycetia bacterium]
MLLVIALFAAIVVMILAIARWNVHPFLAIMGISLLLAIGVGIPIESVPGTICKGFGKTFGSIGLVIITGALIGAILEKTGAAVKLAEIVIRCVGKKYPVLAMALMGWIVSIPVFCDSGFVILDPVRKNLRKKTGGSSVALTVALAAGLYVSHVFIPPTPGPVAASESLGLSNHLILVIGLGLLFSVPPLIAALLYASFIGKRIRSAEEIEPETSENQEEEITMPEFHQLPGAVSSLLPILVPLILLALGSVSAAFRWTGSVKTISEFLGTPVIALIIGLLCAIVLLIRSGKIGIFQNLTNETLKIVGPILFITAAGGVLGDVIASTGLVDLLKNHLNDLPKTGIFFPFLIAAFIKTAQGSSTVAIVTAASIMGGFSDPASLMTALGFITPIDAALVVLAIGAGGLTISHANDSYFWIVTNFGGISPQNGYKTHSMMSLIMGTVSIFSLWIASMLL